MAFKGRRGKARPVDVRDVEVPEFAKEETEELVDVEEGEISEFREKKFGDAGPENLYPEVQDFFKTRAKNIKMGIYNALTAKNLFGTSDILSARRFLMHGTKEFTTKFDKSKNEFIKPDDKTSGGGS